MAKDLRRVGEICRDVSMERSKPYSVDEDVDSQLVARHELSNVM
jgi:hypothetical protein